MPKKWVSSKEKKQLRDDIDNGVVDATTDVRTVYNMHNGAYHAYPFNNFQTNLKNLIKAITKSKEEAHRDLFVLASTLEENSRSVASRAPLYPSWQSSEARMLLLQDLASGILANRTPAEIQQTRPEFQVYPPTVFRDNYNKELHKPKRKAYWEFQKELREEKKQSKKDNNNNNNNNNNV